MVQPEPTAAFCLVSIDNPLEEKYLYLFRKAPFNQMIAGAMLFYLCSYEAIPPNYCLTAEQFSFNIRHFYPWQGAGTGRYHLVLV
jgi:hypothetical protein